MRSGTEREIVPPPAPDVDHANARSKRRRRAALTGALILVALAGVLAFALVDTVRAVQDDLIRGREQMVRGRSDLLSADARAASEAFRDGRRLFARAEARADALLLRAVGWLPIVGRTTDTIDAVAESAMTASEAAIIMADAAAAVPGGLSGLGPAGGRIALDRFPPLASAAEDADDLMTRAVSRIEAAPTTLLLGPVGPARRAAEREVEELSEALHAASLVLRRLPTFLGAEEPQRYFFGAQNPAELRGTGGQIGAYSILKIDDGRFSFSPFVPINELEATPLERLPAPNEDYADYEQFRRGGRFWSSINVMPDFPSVARAILTSFEAATGEALDGVIVADPFAEAALLEATGPVEVPGYGVQIDADSVVPFTTNEAYSMFTDSPTRKLVLGDVATASFERFVNQPTVDEGGLRKLLGAGAARHIQVFSADPMMQAGLRATPLGGALRPAGADDNLVSVVVNSAAGSKVDFYQERTIRYSVDLRDDSSAVAEVDLSLRNTAPTSGQPPYVIGPFGREDAGPILRTLEAGESVALVNVYCGAECIPRRARMDGAPVRATTAVDLGIRFIRHYYAIGSGQERTLQITWDDPSAWEGNSSGGVYRMTFTNQVTIRPATLEVRIEPPEDMRVVSASAPLQIVDGVAVYRGRPGARLDLEVDFGPSLPVRMWRNVTRFLTTPVFEI